jgi:ABC-type branched-subunit amino acid transport system substrate-binding protein
MRSRLMFMVLACAALPCVGGGQAGAHTHLRIGLVIPPASANSRAAASIARGVRLGAAESKQTATLFGDDVELFEITGTGDGAVAAAEQLLSERQVQVLIGAASGDVDALSRFAEARHVLFLNPASRSQSLRAACRHYTFNIEASDATYANVLRLGGNPETPSAPVNRNASLRRDSVVLWSSSLQRFGASQINDRYRVMFREGMDGGAWAGWAAIKIVADAALRARSTSPTRLVTYLESPTTAFDGHKGWQLSFRRTDHQLRQPLYIVVTTVRAGAPNQALRDVPELRAPVNSSDGDDSRAADQVLDRLIGPDTPRICGRQPK